MESLMKYMSTFSCLLKNLGPVAFLKLLSSRVLSINHYYVLRKKLADIQDYPVSLKKNVEISLICEKDIKEIESNLSACSVADRREVLGRLLFYRSGFKNCYIVRRDNKIAYMQWIIYPTENGLITEKYSNKFYPLRDNQVMIENVFIFPPYRGLGYLPSVTHQLLELARAKGYRSAVCYIRKDRIISLTEFIKMGFRITKMMPEYKFLGGVWRAL